MSGVSPGQQLQKRFKEWWAQPPSFDVRVVVDSPVMCALMKEEEDQSVEMLKVLRQPGSCLTSNPTDLGTARCIDYVDGISVEDAAAGEVGKRVKHLRRSRAAPRRQVAELTFAHRAAPFVSVCSRAFEIFLGYEGSQLSSVQCMSEAPRVLIGARPARSEQVQGRAHPFSASHRVLTSRLARTVEPWSGRLGRSSERGSATESSPGLPHTVDDRRPHSDCGALEERAAFSRVGKVPGQREHSGGRSADFVWADGSERSPAGVTRELLVAEGAELESEERGLRKETPPPSRQPGRGAERLERATLKSTSQDAPALVVYQVFWGGSQSSIDPLTASLIVPCPSPLHTVVSTPVKTNWMKNRATRRRISAEPTRELQTVVKMMFSPDCCSQSEEEENKRGCPRGVLASAREPHGKVGGDVFLLSLTVKEVSGRQREASEMQREASCPLPASGGAYERENCWSCGCSANGSERAASGGVEPGTASAYGDLGACLDPHPAAALIRAGGAHQVDRKGVSEDRGLQLPSSVPAAASLPASLCLLEANLLAVLPEAHVVVVPSFLSAELQPLLSSFTRATARSTRRWGLLTLRLADFLSAPSSSPSNGESDCLRSSPSSSRTSLARRTEESWSNLDNDSGCDTAVLYTNRRDPDISSVAPGGLSGDSLWENRSNFMCRLWPSAPVPAQSATTSKAPVSSPRSHAASGSSSAHFFRGDPSSVDLYGDAKVASYLPLLGQRNKAELHHDEVMFLGNPVQGPVRKMPLQPDAKLFLHRRQSFPPAMGVDRIESATMSSRPGQSVASSTVRGCRFSGSLEVDSLTVWFTAAPWSGSGERRKSGRDLQGLAGAPRSREDAGEGYSDSLVRRRSAFSDLKSKDVFPASSSSLIPALAKEEFSRVTDRRKRQDPKNERQTGDMQRANSRARSRPAPRAGPDRSREDTKRMPVRRMASPSSEHQFSDRGGQALGSPGNVEAPSWACPHALRNRCVAVSTCLNVKLTCDNVSGTKPDCGLRSARPRSRVAGCTSGVVPPQGMAELRTLSGSGREANENRGRVARSGRCWLADQGDLRRQPSQPGQVSFSSTFSETQASERAVFFQRRENHRDVHGAAGFEAALLRANLPSLKLTVELPTALLMIGDLAVSPVQPLLSTTVVRSVWRDTRVQVRHVSAFTGEKMDSEWRTNSDEDTLDVEPCRAVWGMCPGSPCVFSSTTPPLREQWSDANHSPLSVVVVCWPSFGDCRLTQLSRYFLGKQITREALYPPRFSQVVRLLEPLRAPATASELGTVFEEKTKDGLLEDPLAYLHSSSDTDSTNAASGSERSLGGRRSLAARDGNSRAGSMQDDDDDSGGPSERTYGAGKSRDLRGRVDNYQVGRESNESGMPSPKNRVDMSDAVPSLSKSHSRLRNSFPVEHAVSGIIVGQRSKTGKKTSGESIREESGLGFRVGLVEQFDLSLRALMAKPCNVKLSITVTREDQTTGGGFRPVCESAQGKVAGSHREPEIHRKARVVSDNSKRPTGLDFELTLFTSPLSFLFSSADVSQLSAFAEDHKAMMEEGDDRRELRDASALFLRQMRLFHAGTMNADSSAAGRGTFGFRSSGDSLVSKDMRGQKLRDAVDFRRRGNSSPHSSSSSDWRRQWRKAPGTSRRSADQREVGTRFSETDRSWSGESFRGCGSSTELACRNNARPPVVEPGRGERDVACESLLDSDREEEDEHPDVQRHGEETARPPEPSEGTVTWRATCECEDVQVTLLRWPFLVPVATAGCGEVSARLVKMPDRIQETCVTLVCKKVSRFM